ncbi:TetR/AcrR family transcriptional regulator [Vannielia litorea]|uniref:TetR/AcrR family transcriptional regulator n=1 Tax=Vannielia litorea TaxID=1217970 RepID=UPI001BD18C9F|nr:TetR/AcrR family transcriptional regulator [Vannielia litorea]MBS8228830.1 TetR/AcrR family transcriptional regulator [Vannielia litorea]
MTVVLKTSHHHGNLRAGLVEAGIEILESEGLDALSLRKCAARAGVSHAAPAHHFDGVAGLREAIATEGFQRFGAAMLREAAPEQDPRARLKAICRGYLAFAREAPALYRLMFSTGMRSQPDAHLAHGPSSAYGILREFCAPFVPEGTEPTVIETQVWALCHGYALFILHGIVPDSPALDTAVLDLVERIGAAPAS